MSLKVTVKSKESIRKEVTVNDLEPGTVFEFNDNVISLKFANNKLVHLNYWGEKFVLSDGSMHYHKDIKILGRLDEIIVVEE